MSANHYLHRRSTPNTFRRKLFLRFQMGPERYVIAASDVAAVLSLSPTRRIVSVPPWVMGLCSYRGRPVPVIDLAWRTQGTPARPVTSTRLVMVYFRYDDAVNSPPGGNDASYPLLGVIVENVNETVHLDATAFVAPGIQTPHARYLGPILEESAGYVQWLRVEDLLDEELRATLFRAAAGETTL